MMNIANFKASILTKFSMLFLCGIFAIIILQYNVILSFFVFIMLGFLGMAFIFPDLGTFAVISAIYGNFIVVAVLFHGVPKIIGASVVLLLAVPMAHYIIIDRKRLIIDHTFLLMLAFFVVLVASSFSAKGMDIAVQWLLTFVQEGLVLYFLLINVVRKLVTLKRVIWVLLLTGSFLGALSLYQGLTKSYDQQFGGLAQRNLRFDIEAVPSGETPGTFGKPQEPIQLDQRAKGPINEPNHYAQHLLMFLPFALFLFWGERSWGLRLSAAATAILMLGGILLSYSRGAFLTIALLLLLLTIMRYIRLHKLLLSGVALLLLMAIAAPGYFARMATIGNAQGIVSHEAGAKPDAAIRGRMTEMLAALMVFLDHPVLGVGPGQYTPFYSIDAQLNPDIAFRYLPMEREAHSLYLGMAAETGIVGFAIFMAIVLLMLYQLWQARRRCAYSRPDLANIATAFFLGIIAYLGTSIFLHLAFQRYYWLLLALAGAALQICRAETTPQDGLQEGVPESPEALLHTAEQSA